MIEREVTSMSECREIIREFSTFRIFEDCNGHKIPVLKSDRKLERIIDGLANDNALKANKDAWARYFLLIARQGDPQLAASLSILAPSDCRLPDIINRLVELAPEPNQEVQVVYFRLIARQNDQRVANFLDNPVPIAEKFLSAHLQKVCWYAANDFYEKRIQFSKLRYQYPLEECLQIASLRASNPINLLRNFKFEYRRITIRSYAEKRLWGIISDHIRAHDLEAKTKSLSDDGILRTLGKRELIEALKITNTQELEITRYCLALQCYKEIYRPRQINHNQLDPPTQEQLQQIAARYNQQRQKFKILELVDLDDIKVILRKCVRVIRDYRSSDSFTIRNHEVASDLMANPLNIMIQDEETAARNKEMAQIRSIITKAFAELPDVAQKILKLWFGLGLTQSDILLVIGLLLGLRKQYEVSRRIKQYKKPLLKALIQQLSEKYPEMFYPKNNTDQIIGQMQEPIDEFLRQYCKTFLYPPLENQLQLFESNDKMLLCLHYRRQLQEKQIAEQLKMSVSEASTKLIKLKQSLQVFFKQWVENTLDVALTLCSSAEQKLASFVTAWLQNNANLED